MAKKDDDDEEKANRDAINNVDVEIAVVLGQSDLRVHQLLKLGRGAVVELEQRTSDPVEIYANDVLIAKGEVVVTAGDKIGVTLTELVKSMYSKMAGK
ncbi:MAG: flagellar motor switch protein FliN [Rhodospirillaceae bacterium]|nr:flagellar motor switch protein FliN [Rhodospirillaceae bacterium]